MPTILTPSVCRLNRLTHIIPITKVISAIGILILNLILDSMVIKLIVDNPIIRLGVLN